MRAAEPQTRVSIEYSTEDHVKDIESGIEKITADDGQFVIACPVAGRRIGRMNNKGNIQLGRRVEDWREFFRIQIAALDVRRQIATDQTEAAYDPAQFIGCRLWVLHRQERPSVECVRRGSVDSRNFIVVQLGCLDPEACRDVKLYKWSGERKDRMVHAHFLHALDQPIKVKERAIER